LQQLKKKYPAIRIIMLTIHEEEKFIVKLIDAGANAYLAKNTEPVILEEAIRSVMATDFYFSKAMLDAMRHAYKYNKNKIQLDDPDGLTSREKEILLLICKEYSSPEIAARLFLSERTVEGHRNHLLQKTGARNAAGLVIYAVQKQLFETDNWQKETF
ncbi:MAG TPA: response regulator transcription factor, partial [Ferruginibacter sp.]|nr:response regulator transcription factor [Ferruginibacter sp.]